MSVAYYHGLLIQRTRIEAFRDAIRAVVRPGDHVVDVGAGLGTFAFFAADAGAARVTAVEGQPVAALATALAAANDYTDRVRVVRGWLPEADLPAAADVILFEDFPPRLLDERTFGLMDAMLSTHAADGVRTIPRAARMFMAPVAAAVVRPLVTWGVRDGDAYGLDWRVAEPYLENTPHVTALGAEAIVAEPIGGDTLSLAEPPSLGPLSLEGEWVFDRDVTVGGLAYWFDLELVPEVTLSNAPGAFPASWGTIVLPLAPALVVGAGARVRATVRPDRMADGRPGWLTWGATTEGELRRGHELAAEPASWSDLLCASPDGIPRLTAAGRFGADVLQLVDDRRTVAQIAAALRAAYPGGSEAHLLRRVVAALHGRVATRAAGEVIR
ncbi:MAG TPA: hypothetical protein VGA37_11205 [Gemmatimonadales bacterium]